MVDCVLDASGQCPKPTTFDFGTRLGLVFVVEAAGLSAIAVLGLLGYIAYSGAKIKRNASRSWSTATHVHWYFLNLLVFEVIQSIGGIIDVRWIADAMVREGQLCTAQGALKQAGDVGVALASLAIALHTFLALVFRWRPRSTSRLQFIVMALTWIYVILIVSISLGTHKGKDYYGNTQYWCWITEDYPVQRIVLEYMWMWITAFLNFLLYIPMALVVVYDATVVVCAWKIRIVKNTNYFKTDGRSEKLLALKMLVYPAAYTVTVLPIAITRWMSFTGHSIPWSATVFSDVLFASSGLLNVILFTLTRPNLLPNRSSSSGNRPFTMNPRPSTSTTSTHSRTTSCDPNDADTRLSPYQSSPSPILAGSTKMRPSVLVLDPPRGDYKVNHSHELSPKKV